MMKIIVPRGRPCSLEDAPPGPFVALKSPRLLCFKSKHLYDAGRWLAFDSGGQAFLGEGNTTRVQPVEMVKEDKN